jgi:hypothetical protein
MLESYRIDTQKPAATIIAGVFYCVLDQLFDLSFFE